MRRMRLAGLILLGLVVTTTVAHATFYHQRSLYQRLGGRQAIVLVVNDFVGNVARDKRINRFFANTDIPRLKRLLVQQICAATGGPCRYEGRSMREAHRGLSIGNGDFDALVQDLVISLDKFGVGQREQRELLAILGSLRRDVVQPGRGTSQPSEPGCAPRGRRPDSRVRRPLRARSFGLIGLHHATSYRGPDRGVTQHVLRYSCFHSRSNGPFVPFAGARSLF